MAAPCTEAEARDKIKVPKEVIAGFTHQALDHISNGMSYPEALERMATDSGLQQGTINSLLRRDPKQFSIAKGAIAQAGRVRQVRDAAEAFAEQLKSDGKLPKGEPGAMAKAWDAQRRLALYGHNPVYPWTHMRNWAVQIPTEAGRARMGFFWRAAIDPWLYYGAKGDALYHMDMAMMQGGDYYDFFKSNGADITPGKVGPGDMLLQQKNPNWGTRSFDALKPARYSALMYAWDHLDPAIRSGDTGNAVGAIITRDMNYATGSVGMPVGESVTPLHMTTAWMSRLAGQAQLMMSSKLFFAKHMDAYLNPLYYGARTVKGDMTPAEIAARNVAMGRWANTVTTHLGILGVNYAFNKAMGFKPPNLLNPNDSDFWRLRLGNMVVPFSPMLEALRLPIVFTAAMVSKGSDSAGTRLWRAAWNAAHPAFHTVYEQASGRDFRGNPVPSIHNLIVGPVKPGAGKRSINIPEYLAERGLPIAAGAAVKEYVQALIDQGVDRNMAVAFVKSAMTGFSSALVGTHMYEEEPKPLPVPRVVTPKSQRSTAPMQYLPARTSSPYRSPYK